MTGMGMECYVLSTVGTVYYCCPGRLVGVRVMAFVCVMGELGFALPSGEEQVNVNVSSLNVSSACGDARVPHHHVYASCSYVRCDEIRDPSTSFVSDSSCVLAPCRVQRNVSGVSAVDASQTARVRIHPRHPAFSNHNSSLSHDAGLCPCLISNHTRLNYVGPSAASHAQLLQLLQRALSFLSSPPLLLLVLFLVQQEPVHGG